MTLTRGLLHYPHRMSCYVCGPLTQMSQYRLRLAHPPSAALALATQGNVAIGPGAKSTNPLLINTTRFARASQP